jgi:anti-sigma factor RsiW
MKVTRDVILDVWPVYESGEASADTRALVEAYLEQDPEFARLIRAERKDIVTSAVTAALPPEKEIEALIATQTLLKRRMQYLALGISFVLVAAIFRFPRWMRLGGLEVGRIIVLGIGAYGWAMFWTVHRRLRRKGL